MPRSRADVEAVAAGGVGRHRRTRGPAARRGRPSASRLDGRCDVVGPAAPGEVGGDDVEAARAGGVGPVAVDADLEVGESASRCRPGRARRRTDPSGPGGCCAGSAAPRRRARAAASRSQRATPARRRSPPGSRRWSRCPVVLQGLVKPPAGTCRLMRRGKLWLPSWWPGSMTTHPAGELAGRRHLDHRRRRRYGQQAAQQEHDRGPGGASAGEPLGVLRLPAPACRRHMSSTVLRASSRAPRVGLAPGRRSDVATSPGRRATIS